MQAVFMNGGEEARSASDQAGRQALKLAPDDPATRYNLACYYSQVGQVEKALDMLENSVYSRSWIEHDSDLDELRGHPRFQRYLDSLPREK